VARALVARHGLRHLRIDDFWYEHSARSGERPPTADVQWLEWTPKTQADDFERLARLMLGHVLVDLPRLPDQPSVVVEGPQVVPDLLAADATAIFLIPSPDFQRSVLETRSMPSSDPARALAARLVKDRLYADRIASMARDRGFDVVEIDGERPPSDIVVALEARLGDWLARSEPRNLRAVRHWENENKVRNARLWIESGDAPPDARRLLLTFACECGELGCAAEVELTSAELEPGIEIVAAGHGR
jgi:hypothetical protein